MVWVNRPYVYQHCQGRILRNSTLSSMKAKLHKMFGIQGKRQHCKVSKTGSPQHMKFPLNVSLKTEPDLMKSVRCLVSLICCTQFPLFSSILHIFSPIRIQCSKISLSLSSSHSDSIATMVRSVYSESLC